MRITNYILNGPELEQVNKFYNYYYNNHNSINFKDIACTDFSDLSTETESSLRFKVPNIMEADLLNMRRIGAGIYIIHF